MEKIPSPSSTESAPKEATATVLENMSEEDVQGIIAIDREIFPTMPVEEEEIRETLLSKGVQVVLKTRNGNLAGYIISLPHDEALEMLADIDTELVEVENGLYIESIGILPECRSTKNLSELWGAFSTRAREKGFKTITAHVRVSEGLSSVFQKRMGAVKHRTIENWADFDEPFDYLEFRLDSKGE